MPPHARTPPQVKQNKWLGALNGLSDNVKWELIKQAKAAAKGDKPPPTAKLGAAIAVGSVALECEDGDDERAAMPFVALLAPPKPAADTTSSTQQQQGTTSSAGGVQQATRKAVAPPPLGTYSGSVTCDNVPFNLKVTLTSASSDGGLEVDSSANVKIWPIVDC